ncbi:D-alanyl-D-alanine carboxypeptidase (penicillin-binding protein 5/6) [Desulfitispora alkaliphila]|uniref:D-alanyl-D-alanine carboxypeptidase family protein n=1 Tax=Desulfitispora alkaliphila TaxID=622674 RepID=UPI003D1D63E5
MQRKRLVLMTMLILAFLLICSTAAQAELELDAEGAILMEATTGKVIYEQDPDKPWKPASVTKVMTLLLALEAIDQGKTSLDDMVLASEYACGYGGSQLYLQPGEEFTMHEMLLGIAVGSGNDASVAVAEHLYGSHEAFVKEMNNKAKELGLKNTSFKNAHGLDDDDHYTSARDMAIISRHAVLNYPEILDYTGVKFHVFREEPLLELYNTNKMLWWFEGTDGLKTGFTSAAKRNLSSTVERDNLRLLAVVLGVEQKSGHFKESMKLYQYGFAQYQFNKVIPGGEEVARLEVAKGSVDDVAVITPKDIGYISKKGEEADPQIEYHLDTKLTAPIKKGDVVGEVVITQDGEEMCREELIAAYHVEKASLWRQIYIVSRKVMSVF